MPESASEEWLEWLQQLHLLDRFEVNRCMKPPGLGEVTSALLHTKCFCDGKGLSSSFEIPRMELIAVTMAKRIDILWRKELQMVLLNLVFWTDNTSVLKYIRNDTSQFKVFVANQVSQILKISCSAQWRYMDTSGNPVDIASRGVKIDAFVANAA